MFGLRSGNPIWLIVSGVAVFVILPIFTGVLTGTLPGASSHRSLPLPIVLGIGVAVLAVASAAFARGDSAEAPPPPAFGGQKLASLAESLGLWVEKDPQTKTPRLTGKRGDIWISATVGRKQIDLVLRHGLRLPPGLRISRPASGSLPADRMRFGNTILDGALLLEGAQDANISWADPTLTEALMAVLHPFPGAILGPTTLSVPLPAGHLSSLKDVLDSTTRLITLLQNPPRPAAAPPRFPGT